MHGSTNHQGAGNSRRDFLVKTAALAGAGALLAGAARKPSATGPSAAIKPAKRIPVADGQPIRLGVIGVGGMGTGHCDAIIKLTKDGRTNVQIVAVCDVCDSHMARAKKLCEDKQPGVKVDSYRKHEELLARDDIHAVLIASPEHWHAQHAFDFYYGSPRAHYTARAVEVFLSWVHAKRQAKTESAVPAITT